MPPQLLQKALPAIAPAHASRSRRVDHWRGSFPRRPRRYAGREMRRLPWSRFADPPACRICAPAPRGPASSGSGVDHPGSLLRARCNRPGCGILIIRNRHWLLLHFGCDFGTQRMIVAVRAHARPWKNTSCDDRAAADAARRSRRTCRHKRKDSVRGGTMAKL